MLLMHMAESFIHTNNRKKKVQEKCQIREFAHFKRIILKVNLAPKDSISEREINIIFRIQKNRIV